MTVQNYNKKMICANKNRRKAIFYINEVKNPQKMQELLEGDEEKMTYANLYAIFNQIENIQCNAKRDIMLVMTS